MNKNTYIGIFSNSTDIIISLVSNISLPKIDISDGMIEFSVAIMGIIITAVSYLITAKLYERKDINS